MERKHKDLFATNVSVMVIFVIQQQAPCISQPTKNLHVLDFVV